MHHPHLSAARNARVPQLSLAAFFPTLALVGAAVGCSDAPTSPLVSGNQRTALPAPVADAVKFWDAGASLGWQGIAREVLRARAVDIVTANRPNPIVQNRVFAYLGLAQYTAVITAEDSKDRGTHPSPQAAVAGASAVVLSYFLPLDAARFEAEVRAQEAGSHWPGESHTSFAAGEAVGRAVGAEVVERARTDRFDTPFTGTIPVGPQYWRSSAVPPAPPLLPTLGQMRTFFLASGDQFRPPPPAFGSPEFLAALAEVRQFSDTRTAEQLRIAQFWAPPSLSSLFDEMIAEMVQRYRLNERRAAHAFALAFMAAFDALIACHDAKYIYWLVRPSQADPGIVLAVPLPSHPSYPSNHSCVDGALDVVLSDLFPAEAARIHALMMEGAISRLYAGLHYRFDITVGLVLGNAVGKVALASDVHGHELFALR